MKWYSKGLSLIEHARNLELYGLPADYVHVSDEDLHLMYMESAVNSEIQRNRDTKKRLLLKISRVKQRIKITKDESKK